MPGIESLNQTEALRVRRALDEPVRVDLLYIIEDWREISFNMLLAELASVRENPIKNSLVEFHIDVLIEVGLVELAQPEEIPPSSIYRLTELGKEVIGVFNQMMERGL